ncbi:MAG: hypothetical protein ABI615_03980 [Chthoniobacterales bacterium]
MYYLRSFIIIFAICFWDVSLNAQLFGIPTSPRMTPQGLQHFVEYEVGSEAQYNHWPHPEWPQGMSGVTQGIGYDNGYTARRQILSDWCFISEVERLAATAGIKGRAAKDAAYAVRDIYIPFNGAMDVFQNVDAPRYYQMCRRIFPGFDDLAPLSRDALASLVYNRGSSMAGPGRIEMREIARLTSRKDYRGIAFQIRAMKRLWKNAGLDGLLARREAEARMVEGCSQRGSHSSE